MRIKLFFAAAILASALAKPLSRNRLSRARADLCRPRRSRHRRPGRRPCPGAERERLDAELAPNVPAGHRRFLVEADVVALIRGAGGIEGRVKLRRRPAERFAAAATERMAGDRPARAESARPAAARRARRADPLHGRNRRAAARDPARSSAAERTGADHRHRPRLPRPRQPARRERDPVLPADRERAADLAERASPPRRAAALGGGLVRDGRRGGRAARARHVALVSPRLHPARSGCPARCCAIRAPTRPARSRPTTG